MSLKSIYKVTLYRCYKWYLIFFLDPKTSEWSFLIKDHDQLMISIKPLEPDVKIEKLPHYILKVYQIHLKFNLALGSKRAYLIFWKMSLIFFFLRNFICKIFNKNNWSNEVNRQLSRQLYTEPYKKIKLWGSFVKSCQNLDWPIWSKIQYSTMKLMYFIF